MNALIFPSRDMCIPLLSYDRQSGRTKNLVVAVWMVIVDDIALCADDGTDCSNDGADTRTQVISIIMV